VRAREQRRGTQPAIRERQLKVSVAL